MSLFNVFDVAGSAMQAQSMRLNTVASNLANANTAAGNEAEVYRAKKPVFETYMLYLCIKYRNRKFTNYIC